MKDGLYISLYICSTHPISPALCMEMGGGGGRVRSVVVVKAKNYASWPKRSAMLLLSDMNSVI
jgi:hypothetical protein